MWYKLILSFCSFFLVQNNECKPTIDKVIIKKVDLDTDTFVRVDCDNFETSFKESIMTIEVTEKSKLKEFKKIIDLLKPNDSSAKVDTRIKVLIFQSNGSVDTLCVDRFNLLLNGVLMKESVTLRQFLLEANQK